MITEDTLTDRRSSEEELGRAFAVLAHSVRRTAIEELERGGPLDLEELARRLVENDRSTSPRSAEVALVHNHLPTLDDTGVVEYDARSRRCELDQATTVRAILDVIHGVG